MMRYFRRNKNTQNGIGLLELMLSLAIIVAMILMATRYFIPTRESYRVNEAINMLRGGINASEGWWNIYKTYTPAKDNTISNASLAKLDLIPERFFTQQGTINPWSGKFDITAKSATQVQFEMDNIATKGCRELMGAAERLNIKVTSSKADCDSKGVGKFTAVYSGQASEITTPPSGSN